MTKSFCSDDSRKIGEDIIGSASNYETFFLIECPQPWMSDAFNSKWVPNNLKHLVEEIKKTNLSVRFLLIANSLSHKSDSTTLLIYQKQKGLVNNYSKREFMLPNIEQAATVVSKILWGGIIEYKVDNSVTRDILICTHGSHDQCCARYGNPFYYHAADTINDLGLDKVRIWKSSHFGGHRFAPTAIDLADGRYYGNLNQEVFRTILTRTGDINSLQKIYRGWGILPSSMQILERELMLHHGWDWFKYKVEGKVIEQSLDKHTIRGKLTVEKPDGSLYTYLAKLIKDESKNLQLKSSCNATKETVCFKYAIASLWLSSKKVVSLSA
jgi:hypothetical protein